MRELVGRERETARLRAFIAELGGGPSALLIEGEPGIGKTALWEATLAAAEVLVLRARCAQAESQLGYAGLADLLGPAVEPVLAELPSPRRHALKVVLGRDEIQDGVEPQLVGRAILEVLESLALAGPILVAIDDVQWLDPASARGLTFAVRRVEPAAPVGLLLTQRGLGGPLPLALDDALPPERRGRLLVGPLDRHDLELLVEDRLGLPLSRALRHRVAAAAGGNPLYALELAAAQQLAGPSGGDPLGLPARLEELLADRLGRLPREAAEPLAAVAGLGAPTVAQVEGALGEPAGAGLDAALDAGVLLVEEGRLRFSHPLLAVAASAGLALSARRRLHARLAATLADAEERARHLVLAADGPDATVAAAVEQAAAAGVDSIEHGSCLTPTGIHQPDPLLRALASRRTVVCPTVGWAPGVPLTPPPAMAARMARAGLTLEAFRAAVARLHNVGVPLIAGSDAGIAPTKPHGVLPETLVALVQAGVPATEALAMATSRAAQACGLGHRKGRLRAGYDADLLLVDGDPLADITALRRATNVILQGTTAVLRPEPHP